MKHRQSILLGALLAAALVGTPGCGPSYDTTKKRNVVLVVVDTLRADHVGYGITRTPALARLAADGVRFEEAFSHAPMTLPSHTALFSSRPPFETGVLNNYQDVPEELPLLAEHMQENGYRTHAVVSLGTLNPRKGPGSGLDRGFDAYDLDYWHMDLASDALERMRTHLDELESAEPFFFFAHFSDPHRPYNAHGSAALSAEVTLDGEPLDTVSLADMTQWDRELELDAGEHVLEFTCDERLRIGAFEWGRGDKRLTHEVTVGELHQGEQRVRIVAQVEEQDRYRLRFWVSEALGRDGSHARYAGEVEYVDAHVGRLLDELRARGLYDDSLIVFTSDHGEGLWQHGTRGHVQNLFDEQLNVPLIVKLPKGHPGHERLRLLEESLVPHANLVPTILDVVGLPGLPGQRGVSLFEPHEPLLLADTHKPEAKRDSLCVRDAEFKMIYDPEAEAFTMYDMRADPFELEDVFEAKQDERPTWPALLRSAAELARVGVPSMDEASAETLEQLEALGYGGGADN